MLVRKAVYTIEEVLTQVRPGVKKEDRDVEFNGDMVHMDSLRYQVFKRSLVCAHCGITGVFMAKERHVSKKQDILRWHFNLYGLTPGGKEVLITKDHILPKSKGGGDGLGNLQTMCTVCNRIKGGDTDCQ